MNPKLKTANTLIAASLCLAGLTACASQAPTAVPDSYLQGTALDRNAIGVTKRTEFLEISIDPMSSQLSLKDKARIEDFVRTYRTKGHGPMIVSLPETSENSQLAVEAIVTAREIAWQNGVEYDEIAGSSHGADSDASEPMIMAFQVYDAIKPDCKSMAEYDVADIRSNNEMPSLGCSIRTNQAAMIADAADLLGQRELAAGDSMRRKVILEKFRMGESTASARSSAESGAVSSAVQ
ncbi:MAG: CpaD family pilus assembly lipoprotein [Hyphomonas oceanitis]|uniref:Pilus assembly protein CpaD n=1 Tax=Hyphomonas oceanitis SCH89 TaxID=1280953 RepID=A0A059G9J2_9PROT|nr:CpaD family pilus assembly lipoprotein [Hyphomonas oceanitis]KDA03250.1 pilus assembly protein CpaD [Hyphomonas oceanitis SCH89]